MLNIYLKYKTIIGGTIGVDFHEANLKVQAVCNVHSFDRQYNMAGEMTVIGTIVCKFSKDHVRSIDRLAMLRLGRHGTWLVEIYTYNVYV